MSGVPTLHMICGKIAAGKSTLAAQLSTRPKHLLVSEDAWLSALFADEMSTGGDYLRCSGKLQKAIGPMVVDVLGAGVSVVMDYPGNTIAQRAWMRGLAKQAGALHQCHVLNPPDAVCLERLQARNASGAHAFSATEEQFKRFAKHFVLPTPAEDLACVYYDQAL